jgi:putative endonuclease
MPRTFTVYILASQSHRLYVGMTGDLVRRLGDHRSAILPSFTSRYRINQLVYFEDMADAKSAIQRETEIKGWSREKKVQLIESTNAGWLDLSADWFDPPANDIGVIPSDAQRARNLVRQPPKTAN